MASHTTVRSEPIRNESKVEEPASCGGDKEGQAAPAAVADLPCPYNSAATAADADSGSDADADPGTDPDADDNNPAAASRPSCPRCSCSRNNNDDKEEDHVIKDEDEDDDDSSNSTNTRTNSTDSEPRLTFSSVVFFTLQSFPEALRAVERNLVYNFGPLR